MPAYQLAAAAASATGSVNFGFTPTHIVFGGAAGEAAQSSAIRWDNSARTLTLEGTSPVAVFSGSIWCFKVIHGGGVIGLRSTINDRWIDISTAGSGLVMVSPGGTERARFATDGTITLSGVNTLMAGQVVSSGTVVNRVGVMTGSVHSITSTSYLLLSGTGGGIIRLPPTPPDGLRVVVKDAGGNAGSSNITVTGTAPAQWVDAGAGAIRSTSALISANGGSKSWIYHAPGLAWLEVT
jgi:hypothetical protein